tara:strand:- start:134 stop:1906 length:1773 start_codon:yes stop_codon:yes gene_type:complete
MPYMQMNLIKKHGAIYIFSLILLCLPTKDVNTSPWVMPDDILVKHDLQILADAGLLNIPINSWPIAWGDVAYNLKVDDPEGYSTETLLSLQRIKQRLIEEQIGGISATAEIKVAKNPDKIMTFFDPVNVKKLAASSASYMSKNLAINLKYEKTGTYDLLDESFISLARGNYSITLGSKKNWWGPGWMGSTVLSSNSRPIRGISIERNFSDPFENRFLKLLGNWDMAFILGNIKNTNVTPDRRFSALRLGIRPLENLELGFSKSAVICNKGSNCGFSKIVDGLIGSENVYDLNTIDYRVSASIFDIPYASYGQISGSSLSNSVGLFGLETWGSISGSQNFESYRVFTELSSTTCGIFDGQSKYGCAYQNEKFPSGYHNGGSNIGYPLDGDSLSISFGGILVLDDTQLYKSTLAIGRINRGSNTGYLFSQDSTDFLNFNLGYQLDLYWYDIPLGSFDFGLGFDIYKNKITGSSEKDPRLYVSWINSLDLSQEKVRDFSDYIEMIEVDDELITTSDPIIEDQIQYVSFNERELSSIISLIDQTSVDRGDTAFANYTPEFKSTNEIIDQLSKSSNDKSLSDYLTSVDETISKRN